MENPFISRLPRDRGALTKLFGRGDPEGAWIAVENLLATRDWKTLTTGDIVAALREYGVKEVDRERANALYAQALRSFIKDDEITDEEAEGMLRLRDLLGLRDEELGEVEKTIIDPFFQQQINDAMRDGEYTDAERERLERLRRGLRIHERLAMDAIGKAGSRLLDQKWREAAKDARISDDELKAIEAMAANFGLRASFSAGGDRRIDRLRWMWLMENGTFPEEQCRMALMKDEVCHWTTKASSLKKKEETTGFAYSGYTFDAPSELVKGLAFRAGAINLKIFTADVVTELDTGSLIFTNKRIVFEGERTHHVYAWDSLTGVTPYSDGIELERESGPPNPLYRLDDPEYATVLITAGMSSRA